MGGRAAPRLGLALVLVALAAARAHPLDRYHTVDADPATEQVVPGPGSVKKSSVRGATTDSGGDGAGAAIDAAVNSWQKDAHAATRLTDVNPDAAAPKRTDGGNTNDAVEAASHHHAEDENESPPSDAPAPAPTALAPSKDASTTHTTSNSSSATPSSVVDGGGGHPACAPCVGCSVDWVAASAEAQRGVDCRGHGACDGCDARLGRINGTFTMQKLGDQHPKRDMGASSATVLRAETEDGSPAPFLKFVCIPGFPRHSTHCEAGQPWPPEEKLVTNTLSLQRLSDFCGLESVSTRSWVARAKGVAPAGLPLDPWNDHPDPVPVDQIGIFSSPAEGAALSALCSSKGGPEMLRAAKSHLVVEAALFDFVFCAGDRHTQNVYVDEDGSIRLIDNDNLLGQQVLDKKSGRHCAVSSLFIPGNMESWRLRRSKYCGNQLGTLDYRCHAGPSGEVKLKPQLETCLRHFADADPEALQKEFGILEIAFARTLRRRSADLLEFGFSEAIVRAGKRERYASIRASLERPTNKTWDRLEESEKSKVQAWRDSMWRPTEPAVCHGLVPNWEGAPFDYRADETFAGGEVSVDETGAQVGNHPDPFAVDNVMRDEPFGY